MRSRSLPDRVPPMPQVSRKIQIDVHDGPLHGRVSDGDGLTSEFEGWLDLLTILVRLLDAPAVAGAVTTPPAGSSNQSASRRTSP